MQRSRSASIFRRTHPDTLVAVTTDHANSKLGLNGMGGGYPTSSQRFATLADVKMSFPEILKRIEKSGMAIIDIIASATDYRMSERRAVLFAEVLAGEYPDLYDQMNSVVTQLGQIVANRTGVGWTGNTHTVNYVSLVGFGPGAEHFRGIVQNTDIFDRYTEFAGIDFKNSAALLIADVGPEAGEVENHAGYALA
jgi:alkaline phosphatase